MVRRSSSIPILLGGLAILLIVLIILASIPRIPLPTGLVPNLGLRMTEEVNPPQVLYATTINLDQGSVWRVVADVNGIRVEQRSSQLIERINLSNVDVSVNDVVAPILWDWYFDGQDDYVVFNGFSTPNFASVYVDVGVDAEVKVSKIFIAPGPSIYFGITSDGSLWYESWNSTSTSFNKGRISSFFFSNVAGGYKHIQIVHTGTSITAYVNGESYNYTPLEDGPIHWFTVMYVGSDGTTAKVLRGRISHIYISESSSLPSNYQVITNPVLLVSATFFNGTHYIDLINGVAGTPYGGVARVPSENPTLFLVKSLESDNKLHLKYVPPNSIFRIKYNGMIYEWRITGEPNAAGLIEDYSIDIASIFGQTVLPNATIELVYDSSKVRFYVPSGFQVVVEGNGWSETHEVPLNAGYVDFGLPSSGTYTVKILGYETQPRIHVETAGDVVRVTVTDPSGYALAGAKVVVSDASGNTVFMGYTNDLGIVEFNKTALSSDQVRIQVVALKDGTYYHADKLVSLSFSLPTEVTRVTQAARVVTSASSTASALAILLIIGIIVLAIVVATRRKR